jgi:dTMP kinase
VAAEETAQASTPSTTDCERSIVGDRPSATDRPVAGRVVARPERRTSPVTDRVNGRRRPLQAMLLTLEGLDGSGKTTVWEALRSEFPTATFTREPTDSWYGENVLRSVDDDAADPLAELFLFTADHADHLSRLVRPALAAGDLVVSDRYSDSRYAYQAATLAEYDPLGVDDPLDYVQEVHEPFTRTPDRTVYLAVDPDTAAERAGTTNKLERIDYLRRVAANYDRLIDADPERFVRVDASQPEAAVVRDVRSVVAEIVEEVGGEGEGTAGEDDGSDAEERSGG